MKLLRDTWLVFASVQTAASFANDFKVNWTLATGAACLVAASLWAPVKARIEVRRRHRLAALTTRIYLPLRGAPVTHRVPVAGTAPPIPEGTHLWLFVEAGPGAYYPQAGELTVVDGHWSGTACVGNKQLNACNGELFTVHLMGVSRSTSQAITQHLEHAATYDSWHAFDDSRHPLESLCHVEVVREDRSLMGQPFSSTGG
jgi:hypothetical protein